MSSWDPGWLTLARSVTGWDQLSRGDTSGTVLSGHTPRIWAIWIGEVIKTHGSPGIVHSPSTWSPELLGPGTGTKRIAHLGLCPCRAPETLSSLDLGSAWKALTTGHSALAEPLRPWAAWTWELHGMQGPLGTVLLQSPWDPEQLGPGNCMECRDHWAQCPCRAPEILSSLDLGSAWKAGTMGNSSLAEPLRPWAAWTWEVHGMQGPLGIVPLQNILETEQCRPGKHTVPWDVAWSFHCEHSPHMPALFVCCDPPSPQHNWTSEPKWVSTFAACVRAEIRHWRHLQTEEAKINKGGTALEVTGAKTKSLHLILETVYLMGTYRAWEQVQARTRDYLTPNWPHPAHNRAREIPRYIFITF